MDEETDVEQAGDEVGYGLEDGGDQTWADGAWWGGDEGALGQQDYTTYEQHHAAHDQQGYGGQDAGVALASPEADSPVGWDEQVVKHDVLTYESEPIRKQAREAFPKELDTFANLWLTAATTALAGAPEPEDEESKADWWMALGGNLIWAATCLVPEGWAITEALMSFGGAAVGSGILGGPHGKAPSGKKAIAQMLTESRDVLVNSAATIMDEAAIECGDDGIADAQEQRKVLWRRLFRTPFDQSEPIRAAMDVTIEAGLADYQQQWKEWRREIKLEALERFGVAGANPGEQEEIAQERPFSPHLTFGG
jgi:hypothetical protein